MRFLGGTDGIRATGLKHAIQNRDADGGFGQGDSVKMAGGST